MSTDTKKWKPNFLSSGVPLEYEVAKLLVAAGFSVQGDYTYHRSTAGNDVEWSIDIRAIRDAGKVPGAAGGCPFDVLVECKHRTRKTSWLFVPEPAGDAKTIQYDAVRGLESFSPWFLPDLEWWTKPLEFTTCYKGVEVDFSNGHVEAAELRHGLMQLQFAIPPLLRSRMDVPATSFGIIDNTPLMFTAVLVTNAPLFVANFDLSTASVEDADEISDVATPVDCLIVRMPDGQDLFHHARRHFSGLRETTSRKGIAAAEKHRKAAGVNEYDLPSSLAQRLECSGDEIAAITNVSSVFVSHVTYLPTLLREINSIADRVASNATSEMPPHWRF
jgi:hypothetical protein